MKEITRSRTLRLLFTVLFCIVSVAAVAQSAGFGAVSGVVTDATGAVVAGAHVNLDNPSKGIHREMDTTSSGNFDFQNIVPASGYEVKVAKTGFGVIQYNEITVQVGGTVTLSPSLKVSSATTQVEVNSSAPLVDFQKTDTSLVVDSDQILELPINGRRVDNFVAFSPGVSNDGAFGLLSFRGNPGGNAFLTDGVDTTNSYYGENAGRTRTYNISQDAVQEFQVVSSNYAAEFGKASGGVINTVTRSGSNNWHGSAYEFYRTATLAAIDRSTVSGLAPKGINPPEWRHQAGVSVGGPVVKNKVFFFFNGEVFRRNAPAVSSNLNGGAGNNLFKGDGTIQDGTVVSNGKTISDARCKAGTGGLNPTQAQCDAATAYVTSRAIPQLIPRTMNNNMMFGKIDWHPTDKDSLSFSSNYLDFRSPNGIQTQLSLATGAAIGNNADTNVFDRTGRVSWTRTIGNNMLNEFRFGLFKDRQVDTASASLLPTFGSTASPVALTVNSVGNLGYAQNYPRVNPSELRIEFSDNFSWTKGKHNLKFGGTVSHLEDFVQSMPSQFPFYQYASLTTFAQDFDGTTLAPNQHYTTYSQTVGNAQVDLNSWEKTLYAQDEWHITPKLVLSPGVRYEHTSLPQPNKSLCNPLFPLTCKIPTNAGNIAPRFGLAYALNNKTAIHAGYGMFNNRYITSTIENLLVANGIYQKSYSFSGTTLTSAQKACLPTFPNILPSNWTPTGSCALSLQPNVMFADPNYHPSYSQQANLAIDRELGKHTSLSVSYVWSRTLGLPVTKDLNVLDPSSSNTASYDVLDASGAKVGSYSTPVYTSFNPTYTFSGTQYKGRVAVLEAGGNSYYNAMLVTFKHRQCNWFNGTASYTYGHTIDDAVGFAPTFGSATPSSYYNGYYAGERDSSNLDRRHNLTVNAVFQPKFTNSTSAVARYLVNGWQLALINLAASSQPTSPTVISSSAFAPCTVALTSTGGCSVAALGGVKTGSLNGLGAGMRVPFESLAKLNVGAVNRLDARISKTFTITERVNVALGFEAFNVFNHLIVSGRDRDEYQFVTIGDLNQPGMPGAVASLANNTSPAKVGGNYQLKPRSTYGAINATQITPDGTTARRAQGLIRINF
jgi:outer membrane receptor for ferrienterochelin and colicin